MLASQLQGYLIHTYVKRTQQRYFESLHDNVYGKQILIQLDFSENFSLTEQNAVQSAHWTNKQCTLFTIHFWVDQNKTQSFTYVSDCLVHGKLAVHKYIYSTLEFVRENYQQVVKIDFFSDGPSSQFKQKYLFSNLEHWEKVFKYRIHWHFFATSHGKGVVDGIGGSVKGSVYHKILAGKVILTAKEVAEVAQNCHANVIIQYIPAEEINQDERMLEEQWKKLKTIPGTQKINSIFSTHDGKVMAAEVSTGIFHEYTLLTSSNLSLSPTPSVASNSKLHQCSPDNSEERPSSLLPPAYQVGQWVIVKYDSKYFPGEITMALPDQIKVNVMAPHGENLWKWPAKEDHIFYFKHDVVKVIDHPQLQNCGVRVFFKIKELDK